VHEGNTQDQQTLPGALAAVSERFGIERVVFVGDRGMITQAHAETLREQGVEFISALKSDLLQNGRSSRRLRTDEPPKSSYSGEGLGALDPHTAIAGLRAPRLSALRGRSLALTRFAGHFAA
jgi:transposase